MGESWSVHRGGWVVVGVVVAVVRNVVPLCGLTARVDVLQVHLPRHRCRHHTRNIRTSTRTSCDYRKTCVRRTVSGTASGECLRTRDSTTTPLTPRATQEGERQAHPATEAKAGRHCCENCEDSERQGTRLSSRIEPSETRQQQQQQQRRRQREVEEQTFQARERSCSARRVSTTCSVVLPQTRLSSRRRVTTYPRAKKRTATFEARFLLLLPRHRPTQGA